jgi:ferritin-like protein
MVETTHSLHPAISSLLSHFSYEHLPPHLAVVSRKFCELAEGMAYSLPADPETTVCIRKLLEAKDCAVRAALTAGAGTGESR